MTRRTTFAPTTCSVLLLALTACRSTVEPRPDALGDGASQRPPSADPMGSLGSAAWTEELIAQLLESGGAGTLLVRPEPSHAAGRIEAAARVDMSSSSPAAVSAIMPVADALVVLERQAAVHSANLANVAVPGYKRRTPILVSPSSGSSGLASPRLAGVSIDMQQGALSVTGNPLDLAIEGAGFFQVQLSSGELAYTRSGTFLQDINGELITPEGFRATDGIVIPRDSLAIVISEQGTVSSLDAEGHLAPIGALRVHTFPNPSALAPLNGTCFVPTDAAGVGEARLPGVPGGGTIRQGCLEQSNVDLTRESLDLQLAERRATALRQVLARHGVFAH